MYVNFNYNLYEIIALNFIIKWFTVYTKMQQVILYP